MPIRLKLFVALLVGALAFAVPVPMALGAPRTRLALLADAGAATGRAIEFPATHLGLTWKGDDGARVQVRWQPGGGP